VDAGSVPDDASDDDCIALANAVLVAGGVSDPVDADRATLLPLASVLTGLDNAPDDESLLSELCAHTKSASPTMQSN
jgi:hypothetical protein